MFIHMPLFLSDYLIFFHLLPYSINDILSYTFDLKKNKNKISKFLKLICNKKKKLIKLQVLFVIEIININFDLFVYLLNL